MSNGHEVDVAMDFTVRYRTGESGLFVGFIREFPFITGQGETFQKLVDELSYDLGVYFRTFPEGAEKLKRHGRRLDTGLNLYGEKPVRLQIERPEIANDDGWKEYLLVPSLKH